MSYSMFGNAAMASVAGMHNLKRLYLRDTSITDEGLQHLSGLTKLEELDLYGVKVTDRGIAALKDLKELRKLILLGAPITDESIPVLAGMTHLRELNLYRSRITNSGIACLAVQLLMTSRLLRRFGIGPALFVVPVALLLGSTAVLIFGTLWAAILLRGSDQVLRYSIDKSGAC